MALVTLELGARAFVQPIPSVALNRGAFTEPGVYANRTPEYNVTVRVNAQGFVDGLWDQTPGAVIVLGDSFVQAAQVELAQGFGRVLAQRTGWRVQSMGVPGAGTATAYDLLREHALPMAPSHVILGFLVGNDVLNNSPLLDPKSDKPFYRVEAGRLVRTDAAAALAHQGGLGWSAAWRVGWQTWAVRRAALEKVALGAGVPVDFRVYDRVLDERWRQAWEVTDALIAAMRTACDAAGVRFSVVLFPDRVAGSDAGERAMKHDWPETADWDVTAPHRRMQGALDLQPAFRAAGPGLYFEKDGHWTAEGHRVAAEAVAARLGG